MFQWKQQLINIFTRWKYYFLIALACIILLIGYFVFQMHQSSANMDNDGVALIDNDQQQNSSVKESKDQKRKASDSQKGTVFVDLKGAVEHPDVYEMPSTARVNDLIKKAKLKSNADISHINLSEKLVDQKMIYIPTKNEQYVSTNNNQQPTNSNETIQGQSQINLNTANEASLTKVPGIGPSKAKEILNYKEQHGQFTSVDELKKIKGIGEKTFEKLKQYFTV